MLNKMSFFFILLFARGLVAQPMPEQSTLLFPINPGISNTLSGTMGELRSSHFHTGIDIRTGGQEGLAVLAADDGYISRVKVKPGGYGNSIYIRHLNGHTTVYAHLKTFNKELATYVRKQQYDRKTSSIDLYTDINLFPISRGDTIAVSGNSGSSGGPHLHFDVRNRNQDLLNPLHYGFDEITDIRPPLAKELALVTSTIESKVNGEFGRITIPFEFDKEEYFIKDTIHAIGQIGLELFAYDRMTNTRFKTGINQIETKVNNVVHMVTTIETWPFSKSRQFYTYVNYEALANSQKRFHKLYIDEGNHLSFYTNTTNKGYLTIEKNKLYTIEITLTDSYENKSTVHFNIKGSSKVGNLFENTSIPISNWRIEKSTLILKTNLEDTLQVYTKGNEVITKTAFSKNNQSFHIWNLEDGIVDSISVNGEVQYLGVKAFVAARLPYKLYDPIADIQFDKNTLFSNLYTTLTSTIDTTTGHEIISIGNPNVPLNKSFTVNYKPNKIPTDKKYWRVYAVWGQNSSYIGGKWNGNQIRFKSRNFGKYTIKADSVAPVIEPQIINRDELVFRITDDLSGINSIEMKVNNQWVLMNYDPKKKLIWAEKPNSNYSYIGKLELTISDNTGNTTIHITEIN
jgi:Peptidase family M23